MKDDDEVLIILGCPLLNTTRSLVDIRESKLNLRVGKEEITFGVDERSTNSKENDEVFLMNGVNEEVNELEELGKLMEEELWVWDKPKPQE